MAVHSLTLNLPGSLYDRLIRRAERTHRPVEVEVLEAVAVGISEDEDLPADLAQAVSALHLLEDAELWRAAQSSLPREVATQIEDLHLIRQFEGLTPNETQVLATLMERYEQTLLVRAQATLLLKQRGHDVSQLVAAS
jgi:plasmid stability protein